MRGIEVLNRQVHQDPITCHCSSEHGQPPKRSNGISQVLLCKIELLDVPADVLHHCLTLLCLPLDILNLDKELLNLCMS